MAALTDGALTKVSGAEFVDSGTTKQKLVDAVANTDYQVPPVEGAFANGDKTKLDGIEAGATADQTGAEIKALYEAEANTNAFTDAEKTKLAGIEAGADVTDAGNVNPVEADPVVGAVNGLVKANGLGAISAAVANTDYQVPPVEGAFANGDKTKLDGIEAGADVTDAANVDAAGAVMNSDTSTAGMSFVIDEDNMASNSATKVPTQQSVKAYVDASITLEKSYKGGYDANTNTPDLDTTPIAGIKKGDVYDVTAAGTFFTEAVEVGDTIRAKQDDPTTLSHWVIVQSNLTPASIKTQYESNADTNAFTDAEKTKLAGIEAGADVTDTANVTAAGALMDSEVDADIKTLSLPANTTISSFGASLVDDADAATARATLGAGDASGPGSSTDNTFPRFDGTGGKTLQAGQTVEDDSGNVTVAGKIAGGINTASYSTSQALTAAQCKGYVIYVTGAATITLPAVADGMSVTIITIGAVAVSVDPNASDKIWLDGTALDDGDKITNGSTAGDIAVLTYYSADGWYASTNGWTDGGV